MYESMQVGCKGRFWMSALESSRHLISGAGPSGLSEGIQMSRGERRWVYELETLEATFQSVGLDATAIYGIAMVL